MAQQTLLEQLPDDQRVAVMLRADGWGYQEIAEFTNMSVRRVRFLLEQATRSFPGILDHRRESTSGRLMRIIYLSGYIDGRGEPVPFDELQDALDMLPERSKWLLARIANRATLLSK